MAAKMTLAKFAIAVHAERPNAVCKDDPARGGFTTTDETIQYNNGRWWYAEVKSVCGSGNTLKAAIANYQENMSEDLKIYDY